ncbi:hypothetical protein V8F06_009731 [Rhypophila decipiens]
MRFALITTLFVALVAAVPERMMESDKEKRQLCAATESSQFSTQREPVVDNVIGTSAIENGWYAKEPGYGIYWLCLVLGLENGCQTESTNGRMMHVQVDHSPQRDLYKTALPSFSSQVYS